MGNRFVPYRALAGRTATETVMDRQIYNRVIGNNETQIEALIKHIGRLVRKQENAKARGDAAQAAKHERLINEARTKIVLLHRA